jgi:hypothetical protein
MTGVSFMSPSSDAVVSDISVMTEIRESSGGGQRLLMVNAPAVMSQPLLVRPSHEFACKKAGDA